MAAITGGTVTVEGLSRDSLQGDVEFCDCLEQMGCEVTYQADQITVTGKPLRGIDVDMNAISDTVQTLAVVALFAEGPTQIRNVAHIRHKETDRISAVATELRKLGATVAESDSGLTITPGNNASSSNRYLQRPPHGNELRPGGLEDSRCEDQRSRLCSENLSSVLRGSSSVDIFVVSLFFGKHIRKTSENLQRAACYAGGWNKRCKSRLHSKRLFGRR